MTDLLTERRAPWLVLVVRGKLLSEANSRDHRGKVHERVVEQRNAVWAAVVDSTPRMQPTSSWVRPVPFSKKRNGDQRWAVRLVAPPARTHVLLTRHGAKMDKGNNARSLKAVEDAIAFSLGVDDGDEERVEFDYAQAPCPRGQERVVIEIREV